MNVSTVSELLDYMETFLNGEDGYSIKYFKQKLKERYSDDIIITTITGKSSIVKQHSFRTYLTVQEWMGNSLLPTEWGWRLQDGMLTPVETDRPIAPDTA